MGNSILKLVCFLQLFDLSTPLDVTWHFYLFAHIAVKTADLKRSEFFFNTIQVIINIYFIYINIHTIIQSLCADFSNLSNITISKHNDTLKYRKYVFFFLRSLGHSINECAISISKNLENSGNWTPIIGGNRG